MNCQIFVTSTVNPRYTMNKCELLPYYLSFVSIYFDFYILSGAFIFSVYFERIICTEKDFVLDRAPFLVPEYVIFTDLV